jgi:hypothetical protein
MGQPCEFQVEGAGCWVVPNALHALTVRARPRPLSALRIPYREPALCGEFVQAGAGRLTARR